MENSHEQRIQNQFVGFCRKVLKNEAMRIRNEYRKNQTRFKPFDCLTIEERKQALIDRRRGEIPVKLR